MATTQYIGARYVPLFADPLEWDKTMEYEPLTIVSYQGNSYTSRQAVPSNIEITDEKFWALTGNYNAQVEAYRKEVAQYGEAVTQNSKDIAAEILRATGVETTLSTKIGTVESELAQNISDTADKITEGYKAADKEIEEMVADESTLLKNEIADRKSVDSTLKTEIQGLKEPTGGTIKVIPYGAYVNTDKLTLSTSGGIVTNAGCQSFCYNDGTFIIAGLENSDNAKHIFYKANIANNVVSTISTTKFTSHTNSICYVDGYYYTPTSVNNNILKLDTNFNLVETINAHTWLSSLAYDYENNKFYGRAQLNGTNTYIYEFDDNFNITSTHEYNLFGVEQSSKIKNGIFYAVSALGITAINMTSWEICGTWNVDIDVEIEDIEIIDDNLYILMQECGFAIAKGLGGIGKLFSKSAAGETRFTPQIKGIHVKQSGTDWLEDGSVNYPLHGYLSLYGYNDIYHFNTFQMHSDIYLPGMTSLNSQFWGYNKTGLTLYLSSLRHSKIHVAGVGLQIGNTIRNCYVYYNAPSTSTLKSWRTDGTLCSITYSCFMIAGHGDSNLFENCGSFAHVKLINGSVYSEAISLFTAGSYAVGSSITPTYNNTNFLVAEHTDFIASISTGSIDANMRIGITMQHPNTMLGIGLANDGSTIAYLKLTRNSSTNIWTVNNCKIGTTDAKVISCVGINY